MITTPYTRWLAAGLLLMLLVGLGAVHAISTGAAVSTVPVGVSPGYVAVDPRTGHAFVTNYRGDSVSILDTRSGTVLRTVAVGDGPTAVVADQRTSRVFVLNDGDNSVSVLGAQTGAVLRTLQLSDADDLVVDEQAGHVIVMGGCMDPGTAVLLDARSGTVLHTAALGLGSKGVAVDARTQRAFVANSADNTVSVLDAATGRVLRTVPVGSGPTEVAVDVQTARAFVTNSDDNTVSVLDAHRGAVLRTIAVGADPKTLAVAAHSGRAFVVNAGSGTVSVLDTHTLLVRRTVAVGTVRPQALSYANPIDVVVDQWGGHAFVINDSAYPTRGSVSVLDTGSGRVLRRLLVGRAPLGVAVDETTAHLFVTNGELGELATSTAGGVSGQDTWAWVPHWMWARVPQWLRRLPVFPRQAPATNAGSVTVLDTSRA